MSTESATITPAMCVAASDAAQELGIILPASHAGAILEAAWNKRSAPTPAPAATDVTDPLARVDYPEGEWMPRMWDLALASSDNDMVGSALTLKAVAASHGYRANFVQQEVPDDMVAASPAAILAQVAPPADTPAGVTLVGRTMDEDGILNWYVRLADGAAARAVSPAPALSGWRPIETAPRDLTDIIVAVPSDARGHHIVSAAYFDPAAPDGGSWWWCGTSRQDYHSSSIEDGNDGPPTHWMPLPPAPGAALRSRQSGQSVQGEGRNNG